MIATKKLRSPLKWHGGKSYLARRIVALMPPHRVYVEPFAGGLSVLLNKNPAAREVAGDMNEGLVNFWRYVSCRESPMIGMLEDVAYEKDRFDAATAIIRGGAGKVGLIGAMSFLINNRFSRGGLGKDFAWSERLRGKRRPGGPVPGELNAWDTIRAEFPAISERVRHVEFRCVPAVDVILEFDGPDTLHYCDPPYLPETRTARNAYAHEMTREDHETLLRLLCGCRGAVVLSGYDNPLYAEALVGWECHKFSMPNHSGQGKTKQRRVECVWVKRAIGG